MKITSEERNALKKEIAEEALGRYNLPSTDSALNKVIDTWLTNKGPLMDLLSKNPNWKPDKYMIAFDTSVDREVNMEEVYKFFRAVKNHVKWTCTLDSLFYYGCANINKTIAKYAADDYPDLRITEGQKTSKAVNKILTSLGVPEKMGTYVDRRGVKKSYYEKAYADYSDAINPLKIIRHTVISCHPVDYLLMSNGNSWSSCHTINKNDRDSGYSGMRCSGTLSLTDHQWYFTMLMLHIQEIALNLSLKLLDRCSIMKMEYLFREDFTHSVMMGRTRCINRLEQSCRKY